MKKQIDYTYHAKGKGSQILDLLQYLAKEKENGYFSVVPQIMDWIDPKNRKIEQYEKDIINYIAKIDSEKCIPFDQLNKELVGTKEPSYFDWSRK